MSTLEAIKEQYAKDEGFGSWKEFKKDSSLKFCEHTVEQIANRFASQKVKEALERAAEKATVEFSHLEGKPYMEREIYVVNKESILSLIKEY